MMKVDCDWNGKKNFVAHINGFKVHMDGTKPFGEGSDSTPKQLVLAELCCSNGMDVVGLLRKSRQEPTKFKIEAEAIVKSDYPYELKEVKLKYLIDGRCDQSNVTEAVNLSQTHCDAIEGILSKGTAISYDVSLNGKLISKGISNFYMGPLLDEVQGLV